MSDVVRNGGCICGRVRIEARGAPLRVGLCHCLACRKQTGGPFLAFAVWRRGDVTIAGDTRSWQGPTVRRYFCPECGSSLYDTDGAAEEIEICLGALDEAPSGLAPAYETWVMRREAWLAPLEGAPQFRGNRV